MNLTNLTSVTEFLGNCMNYLMTQLNNITVGGYTLYYIILGIFLATFSIIIIRKLT